LPARYGEAAWDGDDSLAMFLAKAETVFNETCNAPEQWGGDNGMGPMQFAQTW
jgi:hypothetical protein